MRELPQEQNPEQRRDRHIEVATGGRGEHDELRNARLGELQQRSCYQTFSMIAAVTRIAASGKGIIKMMRSRHRSNLWCMKNRATSNAFQTAKNSRIRISQFL